MATANKTGLRNCEKLCVLCEQNWRDRQSQHCRYCITANLIYRKYGTGQVEAIKAVKREVKEGRMQPPTAFACVDCGEPAVAYEHRDYNRPLDVEPVCRSCNGHRGYAIPKTMTFAEFMTSIYRTHWISGEFPIPLEAFEPIRRKYWPNEQQGDK
jgi:hypothetical protein